MEPLTIEGPLTLDCDELSVRDVNTVLQGLPEGSDAVVRGPRGRHNLAVGLPQAIAITIEGNAGYFVGGLGGARDGSGPDIVVNGFVGWSVGENLMGGTIRVRGSASQSAGSSARGGRIFVEGDASLRAGISLKGGTVAIAGDAGRHDRVHGPGRHDPDRRRRRPRRWATRSTRRSSTWQGTIASLGADAVVEEMTDDDVLAVQDAGRRRPASTTSSRTGSPRWRRPASCTTSRRTTTARTDGEPRAEPRPREPQLPARGHRPRPRDGRDRPVPDPRSRRHGASCRPSTTWSSSPRPARATRSRATASAATRRPSSAPATRPSRCTSTSPSPSPG